MSITTILAFLSPLMFLFVGAYLIKRELRKEAVFNTRLQIGVTSLSALWAAKAAQVLMTGDVQAYTIAFADSGPVLVGMMALLHAATYLVDGIPRIAGWCLLKLGRLARIILRR